MKRYIFFWALGWTIFCILSNLAHAEPTVEQLEALRNCGGDLDCANAYDAIHGEGMAYTLEMLLRECGAASPLANCELDENGNIPKEYEAPYNWESDVFWAE